MPLPLKQAWKRRPNTTSYKKCCHHSAGSNYALEWTTKRFVFYVDPTYSRRTHHIEIYVVLKIQKGVIDLHKVKGKDPPADMFTNPLDKIHIHKLRRLSGVVNQVWSKNVLHGGRAGKGMNVRYLLVYEVILRRGHIWSLYGNRKFLQLALVKR